MFTLIHLLPGGPDAVLFNPHLSAAGRAAMRTRFGLDDPVYIQYFKWLSRALVGDFGFSFSTNEPVMTVIGRRFPATLELFSLALVVALVLAVVIGVVAGIRQSSMTDYVLMTLSYFGISLPIFLFGIFAQDIFGIQLHWLPVSGTQTLGYNLAPIDALVDRIQHLIMPVSVLAITYIANWGRYMRSSMIEVVKQDYMRTARAKGVSTFALILHHAMRNAVIPLITIVAIDFGAVAGGAAITEGVFAWPGMGSLFLDELSRRDYPVLLAMLLVSAVFVILFNLLADILYAVMDPRIRYS
jgi:peptide/nickel transport system permease protein